MWYELWLTSTLAMFSGLRALSEMSNTVSLAEVTTFFALHMRWTAARSGLQKNKEELAITRKGMMDIVLTAPQVNTVGWENEFDEILSHVHENLSPDQVVEEPPAH